MEVCLLESTRRISFVRHSWVCMQDTEQPDPGPRPQAGLGRRGRGFCKAGLLKNTANCLIGCSKGNWSQATAAGEQALNKILEPGASWRYEDCEIFSLDIDQLRDPQTRKHRATIVTARSSRAACPSLSSGKSTTGNDSMAEASTSPLRMEGMRNSLRRFAAVLYQVT